MKEKIARLSDTATIPLVKYALIARTLARETGLTAEDMARVASKNHTNASQNPFAQFRKPRTVEQILASSRVAGDLTSLMCCPRGEGAAAAIVVSEDAIRRLGFAGSPPVRVLSSTLQSELPPSGHDVAEPRGFRGGGRARRCSGLYDAPKRSLHECVPCAVIDGAPGTPPDTRDKPHV